MNTLITVILIVLLVEIIGLLVALYYINKKIVSIEDQLNRFNRNATAFMVDTKSYLDQYEAEMIMEDVYKERALTPRDLRHIMEIWEKSFQ